MPGSPVSIWSSSKSETIKLFLITLQAELGFEGFGLSLLDDPHPDAIRLRAPDDPDLGAYVYCYAQARDRFGLDLEYPPADGLPGVGVEHFEGLTMNRLMEALAQHFEITGHPSL